MSARLSAEPPSMQTPFGRFGYLPEDRSTGPRTPLSARELQAFVDNMPEARRPGAALAAGAAPPRPRQLEHRFVEPGLERSRQPREKLRLYVHACGRLEALYVEGPATVSELRLAARQSFDFPGEQELVLTDKDGVKISDDEALRAMVANTETVYVMLSDNAFHDFERQIDQLQHMQIGYLCDQLAVFRQEHADIRSDVRSVRLALEAEQGARELADEVVRHEVENLRGLNRRQLQGGDEKLEALEAGLFDLRHGLQEEALARETVTQDVHRKFQEVRDTLTSEGKAREHGDERLRLEIEEFRRALQLEVTDREEAEVRLERALHDVREAVGESADGSVSEVVDVRRQLIDVKQALALEQRERITADSDLAGTVKEFRNHLQGVLRDRSTDDARLLAKCGELDTTCEAERLARQQAVTDLTAQLSVIVESIQEEQMLRAAEDQDLSSMVEAMRRVVDEARRKMDEAELGVTRASHDMSKRFDEEARARRESEAKVGRTLAGFQESVTDGSDRRMRELSQRIDGCRAGVEAEQNDRAEALQELSERLLQQRRAMSEDQAARATSFEEMSERLAQQVQKLKEEQQERSAGEAELAAAIQQARALVEQEAQARERADMTLTRSMAAARESMEDQDGVSGKLRGELTDAMQADMAGIRDGIAKVVEAVQQERRSRSEADNKLREDCREALEKEIKARQEQDSQLREEMESESTLRQEVVEVIQQAIEELRTGLETHTHDFDGEGDEGDEGDEHWQDEAAHSSSGK